MARSGLHFFAVTIPLGLKSSSETVWCLSKLYLRRFLLQNEHDERLPEFGSESHSFRSFVERITSFGCGELLDGFHEASYISTTLFDL